MFSRKERKQRKRLTSHGEGHFLLWALRDSPLTREEISHSYIRFGAIFGITTPTAGTKKYQKWQREIDQGLDHLSGKQLISVNEDNKFCLTEKGMEEVEEVDRDLYKVTRPINTLLSSSQLTAKVSVAVNAMLSIMKLVVGFMFNSMALIADGFDNTVDVISAVAVFLGIKYRRELYSTIFIIALMFGTAGWIVYEAIARIVDPEVIEVGMLPIAAAIASGLICYLMSLYQYTVGRRTGSLSLISQSIDSRNHTFVAAAVLIGVIFAWFEIFIVDSIVGLGVACIILKSAVELSIETARIASGEEFDSSRFTIAEEKAFQKHRRDYFKWWLFFSLKEVTDRDDLLAWCDSYFSTKGLPLIDNHFTFVQAFDYKTHIDSILSELADEDLVTVDNTNYTITRKGLSTLNRRLASERYR